MLYLLIDRQKNTHLRNKHAKKQNPTAISCQWRCRRGRDRYLEAWPSSSHNIERGKYINSAMMERLHSGGHSTLRHLHGSSWRVPGHPSCGEAPTRWRYIQSNMFMAMTPSSLVMMISLFGMVGYHHIPPWHTMTDMGTTWQLVYPETRGADQIHPPSQSLWPSETRRATASKRRRGAFGAIPGGCYEVKPWRYHSTGINHG